MPRRRRRTGAAALHEIIRELDRHRRAGPPAGGQVSLGLQLLHREQRGRSRDAEVDRQRPRRRHARPRRDDPVEDRPPDAGVDLLLQPRAATGVEADEQGRRACGGHIADGLSRRGDDTSDRAQVAVCVRAELALRAGRGRADNGRVTTAQEGCTMSDARPDRDGSHDFDFQTGRWRIRNERLVKRLQGCTEWETFEAVQHARLLPGGLGNIDDFITEHWPGFVGMSLRLYNPRTRQWSIYWATNQTGVLYPPVVGSFTDGVGVFEGRDEEGGQPVRVRFTWSSITPTSARWEQEFSPDEGRT